MPSLVDLASDIETILDVTSNTGISRHGDRELTVEDAHGAGHERDRNEHGGHQERDRHDRSADLPHDLLDGAVGQEGHAVSLVCIDEHRLLADIERLLKSRIEKQVIAGYEPSLMNFTP